MLEAVPRHRGRGTHPKLPCGEFAVISISITFLNELTTTLEANLNPHNPGYPLQREMSARKIALALDDSDCSIGAAKWAMKTIVRPDDEVHLLAVAALVTTGMAPAAPLATAGAVAAFTESYHEALKQDEKRIKELLKHVKTKHLQRGDIHTHALPPAGGASGVAESIVTWAKKEHVDLVVSS